MTTGYRNLTTVCLATALAFGLAACGGSSTTPEPTAEELAMQCTDGGGMWENGMCTPAADVQTAAIKAAIASARTAVAAVDNDSTDAEVSAADAAVAAARMAIADATALSDDVTAGYDEAVTTLASTLTAAKTARMTAMNEAEMVKREAAAAMAAKLYAGIGQEGAADGTIAVDAGTALTGANDRAARYNNADVPDTGVAANTRIMVGIGTAPVVALSEDKKTSVAANHGWAGKRFADPAGGEEYEAMVYSNVEAPTPGDKFGQVGVTTAAEGYEYGLNAAGELATLAAANVASPSFDHTAGTKEFELPANTVRVMLSGSYHGVAGTYYCTPTGGGTDCSAEVAASGFTLAGGTWVFKPSNPEARVMSSMDDAYSSYGWWIRTATDGKVTVSAFHDHKDGDAAPTTVDLPEAGTATYRGGAAGKYALSSATGGTNDSGHFTARAMLEAKFGVGAANTISGTINQFVGGDGESRDWSVKLNETDITDTGVIDGLGGADGSMVGTVWTIDGEAAASAGHWSGNLREQGDDGVPGAVTGTFYSTYGNAGKMVGGFGATE